MRCVLAAKAALAGSSFEVMTGIRHRPSARRAWSARWKPSKGSDLSWSRLGNSGLPSGAPPSMASVTPVMKAAPGLSRKQIAALTSASAPRRRSGTWFFSFGISDFVRPP